jgi:ADP-ribose pyrophosphatase YjhB (NUDIX family)
VLDLPENLLREIGEETDVTVPEPIVAVADAARRRHRQAIIAVLFYGSCLRQRSDEGKVVDLYLLADRYEDVHRNRLARVLNALLPPNVYYTFQPYFWAHFAQPTIVLWARDEEIRLRVQTALGRAVATMIGEARGLLPGDWTPAELWPRAFTETYRTELRAETADQARQLYQAFAQRYDRVTRIVAENASGPLSAADGRRAAGRWRQRRVLGKLLSVLRLAKASFTFEDGAAYLMWKIRRHSGVQIELTPWQRRHPILASTVLAWRLYRARGFR